MLALRSVLQVDALDEAALRPAAASAADAVLIDLAGASAIAQREQARVSVRRHARVIAGTGRPVLVRASAPRTGAMDADLEAVVDASLAGVVLAGVEEPQDGRDADVQIRKWEMRRTGAPGTVTLIAEVDSAAGLLALPRVLPAIDRYGAILLDLDAFAAGIGAAPGAAGHALAQVATIAAAAGLQWIVRGGDAGAAHAHGANGVVAGGESQTRGLNSLFTPDPAGIEQARRVLAAWERRRGAGALAVDGAAVDRRAVRHARTLVDRADAITRRESVRG